MLNERYELDRKNSGLLIIDVQEKLFPNIERAKEIESMMLKAIKGFTLFDLPIVVTEQYPKGLGSTIPSIKSALPENQSFLEKTHFSCMGNQEIRVDIAKRTIDHWIVMGIEAHVCVLQTVKDLIAANKYPVVLNDAISSRSIFDFSTAIAEMRDFGARISSTETILFELMKGSHEEKFQEFSELIKEPVPTSSPCCSR